MVAIVKEKLRSWPKPWLLIFDNYDEPRTFYDITSFFPTCHGPCKNAILVTSRNTLSERLGIAVRLDGLTEEESLDLLLSRCSADEKVKADPGEGKSIVKKLGYLPLAIDQAAAYISFRRLPLDIFSKHYETRKEVILNHTPPTLWEYRSKEDSTKTPDLNLSVLTTWELSFDQIGEDESKRERIGEFLTNSAFFNPAYVNESLFETFLRECRQSGTVPLSWIKTFSSRDTWDSFKFQDVVVGLMNLSLIQSVEFRGKEITFSLHPLIKVG